jgi:HEAT repeat protein
MLFGFGGSNVEKMEKRGDVKGLIKALKYEEHDVRWRAALARGNIGDA